MPDAAGLERLKRENSRLLREDLAQGRVAFRALPEVVTLNHTDLCNLRCVMCPRNLAQGTHRLDRRILGYLADELFPTARKLILTTSGGEPLGADFDFLLERALAHAVRIDAVTNGVLLTRDLYRRGRAAFDHLNVSLDSHVPAVYERIRLGARFDAVHENLRAVQEERRAAPDDVLYSASAVVMRSNLDHLAEFVEHAAALGFDGVVFQKLLHSVKPTPEEDPFTHQGEAAVRAAFERAGEAARRSGVDLYLSEFGLPPVRVRSLRAKRPDPILGAGMCWFIAQNFSVMYTGEVYPCCIPTDHRLGNVIYDDPVAIWNGAPFRRLRAAHRSGRGTPFCSGCIHAPHLKARPLAPAQELLKLARRAVRHVGGLAAKSLRRRDAPTVLAPPLPRLARRDGAFERGAAGVRTVAAPHLRNEAAAFDAGDGSLYLVRDGELLLARDGEATPRAIARLRAPPAPRASALRVVAPRRLAAAFVEDGRLLRVHVGGADAPARASEAVVPDVFVEEALCLSDPRAYVRQHGIDVARDGSLWVAEYGTFPGARCGVVHRAADAAAALRPRLRLPFARHMHTVRALDDGRVLVTTGDLASCRRLLAFPAGGGRARVVERAWSGFTAIASDGAWIHFGSELLDRNGLLRREPGLRAPAEFRPLPDLFDLQVRDLVALGGGRVAALLSADADLVERRAGRRAALLLSRDDGATWAVAHEFAADWSDAPEALLRVDRGPYAPDSPARLLTLCSDAPTLFDVA